MEYPAPTTTSITPGTGRNDKIVSITNLEGTNFRDGATAKLTRASRSDMGVTGVVVESSAKITCDLNLNGAMTGSWSLTVTNDDAKYGVCSNCFTVEADYMTITAPAGPSTRTFQPVSGNEYTTDDIYTAVTCSANVNYNVKINCDNDANKTSAVMWEWNSSSCVPSGKRLAAAMSIKAPGGTYQAIKATATNIRVASPLQTTTTPPHRGFERQ